MPECRGAARSWYCPKADTKPLSWKTLENAARRRHDEVDILGFAVHHKAANPTAEIYSFEPVENLTQLQDLMYHGSPDWGFMRKAPESRVGKDLQFAWEFDLGLGATCEPHAQRSTSYK